MLLIHLLLFSRSVMSDCDPMDCSTPAFQASPSFTISQSLLKVMSVESVMPSNYLILCCFFLLLSSVFSSIRVFSKESILHIRWSQSIGVSVLASVLPMNIQGWLPLGLIILPMKIVLFLYFLSLPI